jgi:hypothetical protein
MTTDIMSLMNSDSKGESYPKRLETYHLQTTLIYKNPSVNLPFIDEPIPFATGVPDNLQQSHVSKRSPSHGRATFDNRVDSSVLFEDEYGNIYTTREWKGNTIPDFRNLIVTYDNIWGVATANNGTMVMAISDYMRQIGLPTEFIVSVYRVDTVLYDGVEIPISEAKERYVKTKQKEYETKSQLLIEATKAFSRELGIMEIPQGQLIHDFIHMITRDVPLELTDEADNLVELNFDIQSLRDVATTGMFKDTQIVAIERCLPVGGRIKDLNRATSKQEYRQILKPVFRALTMIVKHRGNIMPYLTAHAPFNIQKDEDIYRYLHEYLPTQMGAYLGRLHKHELAHGFAHWSNWILAAILVDLDSVIGKMNGADLGEKVATAKDYHDDIFNTYNVLINCIDHGDRVVFGRTFTIENVQNSLVSFISSYIIELFREDDGTIQSHTDVRSLIDGLKEKRFQGVTLGNQQADEMMWESVYRLTKERILT